MPIKTVTERRAEESARVRAAADRLSAELAAYARQHGGRFVLFGSAARDDLKPESDIDIAVDFPEPDEGPASRFAESACAALGLRPDVRPLRFCGPRLRARLEQEGRVLT